MQKIVPHLWYDNQARNAAKFYTSIFNNSSMGRVSHYGKAGARGAGRRKGSVMTVTFDIEGQQFIALNGGPAFTFTPAISFYATCRADEIDGLWQKLSKDSKSIMMELDKYPFAEKYGWLQDKYGVSWQLIVGSRDQKIAPCLMFTQKQAGKAEEAMHFYVSLFPDSNISMISHYGKGAREPEANINHAEFKLASQDFICMDSSQPQLPGFNEAISFLVNCRDQEEIDHLWQKLTGGGEEVQCGWLKDKYGLSWQITPAILSQMLEDPDESKTERVMEAFLQMKKIEIEALRRAYEGKQS
jgi:predicted 3-demethylubiquinone-9 3-methyltransferase (glyoxalase superfamily)